MPLAFKESKYMYVLCLPKEYKQFSNADRFAWNTKKGMENRAKVCVNIAIAVHNIHLSQNYTMVDYKPQNVLITDQGQVSIIDIDSIQISQKRKVIHYAHVSTPGYTPPESSSLNSSKEYIPDSWDRFSLAVTFYEILLGVNPFTGTATGLYEGADTPGDKVRNGLFVHGSKKEYIINAPPPNEYFHYLPDTIKAFFNFAFEEGHGNPDKRPTAQDWGMALTDAINKGQIQSNPFFGKLNTQAVATTIQQPVASSTSSSATDPEPSEKKSSGGCFKTIAWITLIAIILYVIRLFLRLHI